MDSSPSRFPPFRFLEAEDRRVLAAAVVVAADLAGDEVDDDGLGEGRVWVLFESRVGEEGDLGRGAVEFQQVEVRADVEAFAEFGDGDAELGREGFGGVAGVGEVDRAGEAFAVGEGGEEGLLVRGGHGTD